MKKTHITILAVLAHLGAAHATILFDGTTHTENFDTLATAAANVNIGAGTAPAWANDTTLDGWYAGGTGTLTATYGIFNGSGSSTGLAVGQNGVGSFGAFSATERALAPLKRNNSSFVGLALLNNSGDVLTDFTITYTAERWRDNAVQAASQVGLDFAYQANALGITSGTWTPVAALTHNAPAMTNAGTLDGNDAANRETLSFTLVGLNIADGDTVWLRWGLRTSGNNGSYVAIDDLSVTAIPEPGSLGLVGIALGSLLLFRRRK